MSIYQPFNKSDYLSVQDKITVLITNEFSEALKDFLYFNLKAMHISLSYDNSISFTCEISEFLRCLTLFKLIKKFED